ncbi:Peptidyl-prolyl isomerase cwc27 [Coemansia sp. RSA 2671]|uniref:Peptidyl-prolyl isomerase cwc27 n=1 Tax=Coemansia linderi TaxID=2663919 RepID=A0ACC1KN26_9FUNG|nr:Peptidyl-prolyl isomerase cwc27 [Coemansia sp. RSA 2671]KAJ2792209.1 Peptidyl-prolyl isomerase cwc27 [Coemansia linderi]
MSNIYVSEPPTSGKVTLETTAGEIEVELWSKQSPKACRNFIQLCLEGLYDGTIFHRVVPGWIVQGGDPTGTGEGMQLGGKQCVVPSLVGRQESPY